MPSYDVKSGDKSTLAAKINSSQTTGVTIAAMNINGALTGWANTAGVIEVSEQSDATLKREWIYYTGSSVDATTKVATLSGVVRGIAKDTSDVTSGSASNASSFSKGAVVRFVTFHDLLNKKANVDRANTWTAAQTVGSGGSLAFSSTAALQYVAQNVTTTQRDNLTGVSNGGEVYNTTTGQMNWREGGAWVANAAGGSVADGSTTVAGKFEEATVAEQGSATATGGTGARLVVANANLVKTSSGAGDENKLVVAGSSGTFATGFIGTGTANSTKYLRGDGTWQTLTGAFTEEEVFGDGSDGALNVTSGTTTINLSSANVVIKQYTSINVSNGATLDFSNPASDGTIIIFKSQGNVTFAGTVDLRNLGAVGGAGGDESRAGTGTNAENGANGTNPFNNLGLTKRGGLGQGTAPAGKGNGAGGGGAANVAAGVAGEAADNASGGSAGEATSAHYLALAAAGGITVCPGGGGAGGGVGMRITAHTSGTFQVVGGAGGRGAGAMLVYCAGNYTDATGTINLSGTAGSAGVSTQGSGAQFGMGAGGGGGGAGGIMVVYVKGTITQTGTHTTTAGAGGAGDADSAGGDVGAEGNGGDGAGGLFVAVPIVLGY